MVLAERCATPGIQPAASCRLTYPDGSVVERTFDALGRLTAITDGAGHRSTFAYDVAGNLVDEQLGNGVATSLAWDAAGRLSSIDSTHDGAALVAFGSQRDASGAFTAIERDGVVTPVGHDAVGRLASVGDQRFGYDAAGNLTVLGGSSLDHDAGGRLDQRDRGRRHDRRSHPT